MSKCPDVATLRAQLASDRQALREAQAGLTRIRSMSAEEIKASNKKQVLNWSRSSTFDYNRFIDDMDAIEKPSASEKETMRLLNELLFLGDNLLTITNEVLAELEIKHAPTENDAHDKTDSGVTDGGAGHAESQESQATIQVVGAAASGVTSTPKQAGDTTTTTPVTDPTVTQLSAKTASSTSSRESPAKAAEVTDPSFARDPKGVYALLGVEPDVPMSEIQKAKRKWYLKAHPDRNPGDATAAIRFADQAALMAETIDDEAKREMYDSIRTADELEQLTKRIKSLSAT